VHTPRETTIVQAIVRALRKRGAKVIKTHGGPFTPTGTPDLVGCVNGRAFVLEVKRPGQRPRRIQEHELEQWRKAGAIAGVVTSVEEALAVVFGETSNQGIDRKRPV